jgi:hypothetical protein
LELFIASSGQGLHINITGSGTDTNNGLPLDVMENNYNDDGDYVDDSILVH